VLETRTVVLGHSQREGSPTAFDRILATRFGIAAIDLVKEGKFGQMVALRGNEMVSVLIEEAVSRSERVAPNSMKWQRCSSSRLIALIRDLISYLRD